VCVIVLFLINSPIKNWRGLQYVSIHYVIIQMRFAPFNELYIWTSEMIHGVQFVQSFYKVGERVQVIILTFIVPTFKRVLRDES
jgi:hypothetical protein